ncbi:MAG: RNA 2'-phosphotransferase [Candidatus Promineifilaceae bacterium]
MIDKRRLQKISKAMAHALRHAPEQYGIALDDQGWTDVNGLLAGLSRRRPYLGKVTRADLDMVLAQPGKRRYEMTNGRIRALYGHSVPTKIEKETAVPPELLYHGTTEQAAKLIAVQGLKSMQRQYVHLSIDVETAVMVGRRRTKEPVVWVVAAREAHDAGVHFYPSQDEVWLAEPIPPQFITLLEQET